MSNTMKVISNQGELYIGQQEHKRYKNIELFGYGYIDWGRVINQSLVTLYDLIDSIQDGGVSEIEFDLKNYEEQQKVLRKDEFTTWKNEFKNLLTMEINKYQTQVTSILENYNDTISEIRETTTTSIQENYENLSEEIGGIYTQVEKTIDEQIQINIRSLVEKINLANQNVESASQQLSQATSSMNASVQEVNNLIINFKTAFEESFNQFKNEVERTLIAYKDTLIKYIDDKIITVSSTTGDLSSRIEKVESDLAKINISTLNTFITTTIENNISGIINQKVNQLNMEIDLITQDINELELELNSKISDIVVNINSGLDNKFEQINMVVETLNKELVNLKNSGENSQVEVSSFLLETKNYLTDPTNMAKNMMHLKTMYTQNTLAESINIRMLKMFEALIEQNDTNIKNLKAYIDSEKNNFLNALRGTDFDELSLLNNRPEEKTMIENRNSFSIGNLENTTFSLNDVMLLGKELYFDSDKNQVVQILLNLNIPSDIFPNFYDGAELQVSINNRTPYGKDRNYYRTVLVNVPRFSNSLLREGDFLKPNFYLDLNKDNLSSYKDYNFLNTIWYSKNGPTDPIVLEIVHENLKLDDLIKMPITVKIIGKTKSYSLTFKIEGFAHKSNTSYIYNLIETKTDFSQKIQNLINDKIIPYLDFVKNPLMDNNGVSLPVCEIQSQIKNGLETKLFRIKVNLPVGATLSNITYKIGSGVDIIKSFGNVKYNPNYNVYLANKSANSDNDLYFTDLQTTCVLKIPIASNASSITGTVNYKIGSITKTVSFSI